MITARLVGDDAVLAWLRAAPDLVVSGLGRAITTLGIELQRKIQEIDLTGQTRGVRSGSLESSTSLQLDQSGDRIAATISSGSGYTPAREYGSSGAVDIGANLRRRTKAFARATPRKPIGMRPYARWTGVPEPSFLQSALEEMEPAIRDEVEAALREALTL
jgi:hypothetical protein